MRKFIFFLMVIALFPISQAFAQTPTTSTGCAAMNNVSGTANPSFSFGPDDFFAGETITVTVSGAGTDFTLSEDATSVGTPSPAPIGQTLTYEVAADGNFTYTVDVSGTTDLTTTATLNCEPAATTGDDDDGKVTLCHRPPGNPDAAHTITVGAPAEAAHLAHGDEPGECPDGVDSEVEGDGGVTFFVLDESGEVNVFGACEVNDEGTDDSEVPEGEPDPDDLDEDSEGTGANCSLLAVVDVSLLEPVEGFSMEFDEDPDDDFYVIVWYLGQSSDDETLAVYQINVYENGLIVDDSLLIFVNADGEIVDWDENG